MRLRILVAAAVTALVMMPAGAALAEDQEVDIQVLPADTLAIMIQPSIGFNVEIGQTQTLDFNMEVTNTTDGGWVVSVDGPDLQSYYWESCDEFGNCSNRILTGNEIARSNVVVTGADTSFSDMDPATDPAITASSGPLGPVTIMTGTAGAYGRIGFSQPPTVEVTVPAGTAVDSYFTTLTYTITAP